MSRFKKCDTCGNIITKLGVDGFRHKSGAGKKFGEGGGSRVIGRMKGGEKIVEGHSVMYMCRECEKFYLAENNIDIDNIPKFIDLAETVKTPADVAKVIDKKSNKFYKIDIKGKK